MWPALFAAAVAASTGLLAKNHLSKRASVITDSDPQNDAVVENATPRSPVGSVSRPPWDSDCEDQVKEGIFRFSSDGGSGEKKKKTKLRLKKKKNVAEEQQQKKKSGRRVGVCLKRRKTVPSKCGSSSNPKG